MDEPTIVPTPSGGRLAIQPFADCGRPRDRAEAAGLSLADIA